MVDRRDRLRERYEAQKRALERTPDYACSGGGEFLECVAC